MVVSSIPRFRIEPPTTGRAGVVARRRLAAESRETATIGAGFRVDGQTGFAFEVHCATNVRRKTGHRGRFFMPEIPCRRGISRGYAGATRAANCPRNRPGSPPSRLSSLFTLFNRRRLAPAKLLPWREVTRVSRRAVGVDDFGVETRTHRYFRGRRAAHRLLRRQRCETPDVQAIPGIRQRRRSRRSRRLAETHSRRRR